MSGDRPQIGNRPGTGNGGSRPGIANRPNNTLPGLSDRFPNAVGGGFADNRLPNNIQDRRNDLQDRLGDRGDRQDNRQDNRGDRQDNRQDNRGDRQDNRREDWQNWANNNHNDWHDYNHGDWWDHMWDEHPGWMAFGLTTWGVNRLAYGFGLWGYSNPYYSSGGGGGVYDYSQPIMSEEPVYVDTGAAQSAAPPSEPAQAAMSTFDQARSDFYAGNYESALTNVNQALKEMPKDTVVHEFRALTLFALGRYNEAASTIHPVLAVGPGWDWPTLVGLYPSVDVYTDQLRKLEVYARANPSAADAMFLLAYQYLSCGYKEAAHTAFEKVVALQPGDAIAAEYAKMTEPESKSDAPVSQPPAVGIAAADLVAAKDVVGTWVAKGGNNTTFSLHLTDGGKFTWTFTQGKNTQTVKGVYALDENRLAMEPDTGGTMLAHISKKESGFHFDMEGAAKGDPGLDFAK